MVNLTVNCWHKLLLFPRLAQYFQSLDLSVYNIIVASIVHNQRSYLLELQLALMIRFMLQNNRFAVKCDKNI